MRSVEVSSSLDMLRYGAGLCDGLCVVVIQQRCDKFEMPCASERFSVRKTLVRKGKDLIEFLLQRGFVKSITSLETEYCNGH